MKAALRAGRALFITNEATACSEDRPDRCHRRLVPEYLNLHWGNVEIVHLG